MTPTYYWLIAGVVLVAAETIGVTGIGLIFLGLGALVTGSLLQFGLIEAESVVVQFTVFFAATAFWALALWKVVKRSQLSKHSGYSNMVGETAFIGSQGLAKGMPGEVTWSGTIMRAELAKDAAVPSLPAGAQVTIVSVNGATLFVKPKE